MEEKPSEFNGSWGLHVDGDFDRDGELEFRISEESSWLDREEVIKLRDHLNNILETQ